MSTNSKALAPDFNAYHPSAQTTQLTQLMAQDPSMGVMRIGSQMGDSMNSALYQRALADAQTKNLAINQMEQRAGILKEAIGKGPDYVKVGGGLDALLSQVGVNAGFDKATEMGSTTALDNIIADSMTKRASGVKSMSDAGFTQMTPNGTVDDLNLNPLASYVNPGDQAAMAGANKITDQWANPDGSVHTQPGVLKAPPGIRQPANANPEAPGAASISNNAREASVAKSNALMSVSGYSPAGREDTGAGTVLTYKNAQGNVSRLFIDKNGVAARM